MFLNACIKSWVWWLLPFLVARALMPVGFMAQTQDGRFKVVLCSTLTQPTASASTLNDAGNDTGHDTGHGAQSDVSCPFAVAALAPLPAFNGSEAIAYIASSDIIAPAQSSHAARGPPRIDRVRGPPHA